jgi:hypothetical protein
MPRRTSTVNTVTCGCFAAADLSIKITEMAEGVGFEPTVSFPTLDFESSALNRTQPPFQQLDIVDLISACAIFRSAVCFKGEAARERSMARWTLRSGMTASIKASRPSRRRKMLQFWACHAFPWGCILYVPRTANAITCCSLGFTSCLRRCSQVFASY